jgi:hypothetical protein
VDTIEELFTDEPDELPACEVCGQCRDSYVYGPRWNADGLRVCLVCNQRFSWAFQASVEEWMRKGGG